MTRAPRQPATLRPFDYAPPKDPWLDVLHEDETLIVLNKPSGILSVAGNRPGLEDCLVARAEQRWPGAKLIHRLDKDTSGVFIMGRHHRAQRHVSRQFESRRTIKHYVARVDGLVTQDQGTIDLPLATDPANRPMQRVDQSEGRPAITHWRVLEREAKVTRLHLRPETGRSHQLRVHMRELGHTILGDNFYADERVLAMADRLQLHALGLTIRHPDGGTPMTFFAPVPF